MPVVTLKDLASELQITPAAVSLALKEAPNISAARVKQVKELARRRGYRPNLMAKSLREQSTKLIGFMLPDFGFSAESQVFAGTKSVLSAEGYLTLISLCHWSKTQEQREVELMMQRQVEGVICQPLFGNEDAYRPVIEAGLPFVAIGEMLPKLPKHHFVQGDDAHAIQLIVKHLVELGHQRIAFLAPDVVLESPSLMVRLEAYRDTMRSYDLPVRDELIALGKLADADSIHHATEDLMSLPKPPTAIVPVVDVVAYQAMDQLTQMGVSVPGDVSLASMGNFSSSSYSMISLTTVGFNFQRMGNIAGKMITRQISEPGCKPLHRQLKGELIVRNSTGPLRHRVGRIA